MQSVRLQEVTGRVESGTRDRERRRMPKPRIEVDHKDVGGRATPGAVAEGVKSQLWLVFYPHPNLPPARGKELSVNANIK